MCFPSHPSRVRELKRVTHALPQVVLGSHPSRVRELKRLSLHLDVAPVVSHPSRVRELKRVRQATINARQTSRTPPGCVN